MLTLIIGSIYRGRYNRRRIAEGLQPPSALQYWAAVIGLEFLTWMAIGLVMQAVAPTP